jgi:hypothetical protein
MWIEEIKFEGIVLKWLSNYHEVINELQRGMVGWMRVNTTIIICSKCLSRGVRTLKHWKPSLNNEKQKIKIKGKIVNNWNFVHTMNFKSNDDDSSKLV